MSTNTKGVVSNTSAKDWPGRNGTVTLYSFQIEGDRTWYRCGTDKPPFSMGDSISFDYESDGKNNTLVPGSVTKMAATAATRAPAPKAGKTQENWDARAAYWDAKEKRDIEVIEPRIALASSRSAAIEVVGLALAHDAIVFGNAAKGARLQIILAAVDEVTGRFYAQSMNAGKEEVVVKTDVKAKKSYKSAPEEEWPDEPLDDNLGD